VFDKITKDDLIIAFFPCIYFTGSSNPCYYRLDNKNYATLNMRQKFDAILTRADNRNNFYKLLYKFCCVCLEKGLRLVIENPFSSQHFLYNNFLKNPTFIDSDRTKRGDFFIKPTGYWFFNCVPTYGESFQKPKKVLNVWAAKRGKGGICSTERSMISTDYARNWICDFVLGKTQNFSQNIFDF
jgi:hypothetical protein